MDVEPWLLARSIRMASLYKAWRRCLYFHTIAHDQVPSCEAAEAGVHVRYGIPNDCFARMIGNRDPNGSEYFRFLDALLLSKAQFNALELF